MNRTSLHRVARSHFAEARLCRFENDNTSSNPEAQQKQHMEAVHKALMDIGQGTVNPVDLTPLRTALEAGQKNPLTLKSIEDLRSRPQFNSLAPLLADTVTTTVSLTQEQRKAARELASIILPQNVPPPQDVQKVQNAEKVKKLLADLQALKKEVGVTQTLQNSKQQTAKLKEQMEKQLTIERQIVQRVLANMDPDSLQQLANQIGIPDLATRLPDLLNRPELEESRKQIIELLSKVASPNGLDSYIGDAGILKMATSMIESKGVQGLIEGLRERGISIPQDKIVEMLFGALRGFINDFMATSRLTGGSADMVERGRSGRFRMELERAYRSHLRQNGAAQPGLTEILGLPASQMEEVLLQPDPKAYRARWESLYDSWLTVAQNARRQNLFGSIPPAPTIGQAANADTMAKYLKFINAAQQKQEEEKNKKDTVAGSRDIGTLSFPPSGALDVTATAPRTVMHGTPPQAVNFDRSGTNCRIKVGAADTNFLTFAMAEGANQEADSMILRAPGAPSTNTGDIDVVVKRGTGAEKTVKLETLVKLVDSGRTAIPRLLRIIVTDTNQARLVA